MREAFKTTNLLGEPQDVYRSHSLLASSPRSISGKESLQSRLRNLGSSSRALCGSPLTELSDFGQSAGSGNECRL